MILILIFTNTGRLSMFYKANKKVTSLVSNEKRWVLQLSMNNNSGVQLKGVIRFLNLMSYEQLNNESRLPIK